MIEKWNNVGDLFFCKRILLSMSAMMFNPLTSMGKNVASTALGFGQTVNAQHATDEHFILYTIFGLVFGCCLAVAIQLMVRDNSTFTSDEIYGWNITSATCFGLSSCALSAWIMYVWYGG